MPKIGSPQLLRDGGAVFCSERAYKRAMRRTARWLRRGHRLGVDISDAPTHIKVKIEDAKSGQWLA